jgi:hypothetical protein
MKFFYLDEYSHIDFNPVLLSERDFNSFMLYIYFYLQK